MSTDVRQLYRDLILEHSKQPRGFRRLDGEAEVAEGYNPLCGDTVRVYAHAVGGVLGEVAFQGSSCAIATASASLMTEAVQGRSFTQAAALCEHFETLLTSAEQGTLVASLGNLAVFAAVRQFPSRVKCALLPWQMLQAVVRQHL
jgi:nitrogen fixation NifU-like protein